jgi:hypothetical protein
MNGIINSYLTNKENSLFLTILNYFRQILVAFRYFVQSDWRIRPSFKRDSCSIFSFLAPLLVLDPIFLTFETDQGEHSIIYSK